jgi:gliding-associated putative ABC transporter substrate-binding component GldG
MAHNKVKNLSQAVAFVLAVFGVVAALNVAGWWWFGRIDLSENRIYSISPATKQIIKGLDDIVNVKVFFSSNLPSQLKSLENDVRDLLNEYKAFAGNKLRITWEDPTRSEELKQKVREYGIPEVQLNTYEKDKAQVINGYLGIAVLYADKKEVLPVVQEMKTFEYDLTQAIMKVGRSEEPKVAILKTDTTAFIPESVRRQMRINQEDPTQAKYKPLFERLEQTYEVELVSVAEGEKIDPKFRTLVVPGGSSYSERALFEIDQYFMNGGNLIVLTDPIRLDFQYGVTGTAEDSKLYQLLEHYGVRVEKNLVVDAACGQVQIPQRIGMFQMNVARDYPLFVAVTPEGFNRDNPAVSTLGGVILPWVSPLTLLADSAGPVKTETLVSSSQRSWIMNEPFTLAPTQDWQIPVEGLKPHNLAVHLSGSFTSYFSGKPVPPVRDANDTLGQIQLNPADAGREVVGSNSDRHLVVVGDADFPSDQNATPGNLALMVNLVDWLSLDENLISVRTRTMVDRFIRPERLQQDSAMPAIIRWVNILAMPVLLAIMGLFIYMRRRERIAVAVVSEKTEVKA